MMRFKDDSVKANGMRPELLIALMIVEGVYAQAGAEMVITSLNDSKHSKTSLHYSGAAADLRSRELSDPVAVVREIKRRLNGDYDVLYEGTHIHIEWQPRAPD
jgi:hypothetical protein